MDFYSELAKYYDLAFPFENTIAEFLNRIITGIEAVKTGGNRINILDIACGTGTYTAFLAEKDIDITGLDFDSKMIEEASQKFEKDNLKFIAGNMLDLGKIPGGKKFDAVYCIGNSIVHLENESEIDQFIGQCRKVLLPGGTLILQIINFDRIIDQNITNLPTLETDKIRFIRNYSQLDENHVGFDTEIFIKEQNISFTNSIPLLKLRKSKLIELLESNSFKEIVTLGSYTEESWKEDSFLTIVTGSTGDAA